MVVRPRRAKDFDELRPAAIPADALHLFAGVEDDQRGVHADAAAGDGLSATDTRAQNIGDQFMFGPAMLVNPVTEPGATTRQMYLPKAKWYNFWTGRRLKAGR